MSSITVVVHGALGKMGQEVINALCKEPKTKIVGAVDLNASQDSFILPDGSGDIPLSVDLNQILANRQADVLVDFTIAKATMPAVRIAAKKKVNLVIGTSGLTTANLAEIERLTVENGIGAVVATNFALGAVLMIHLAMIASKYLDYAEIIELHHNHKVDSPSGTAMSTARAISQSRGKPFNRPPVKEKASNSRGELVEGVNIHSVRLPGMLAHQEIIMGASGQTLSIRHDQINRESFMPGVILAVKEVVKRQGLIYGLNTLLGFQER